MAVKKRDRSADYWTLCSLFIALALSSCAPAKSAQNDAAQTPEGAASSGEGLVHFDGPALPEFRPDAGAPEISYFAWGADGRLYLGYTDGKWGALEPRGERGQIELATKAADPVVALSPNAELALVESSPPTLIRLRDHQVLLRLNKLSSLHKAGFFPSASGFFVGDQAGTLHVWKKSEDSLKNLKTRDLKDVIARQTPAFSAQIAPLTGQIAMSSVDDLFMATDDGTVLRWNYKEPSVIDSVVRLPGAGRSLDASQDYLVATSEDGALRVVSRAEAAFLPWSLDERAEVAAASSEGLVVLGEVDGGAVLAMRSYQEGAYSWRVPAPGGKSCGLALSPDAQTIALCLDAGVIFVDSKTGEALAAARRSAERFEWR